MPSSSSSNKSKEKKHYYQRVIIPPGVIDPKETAVIEIPYNLRSKPVVLAKKVLGKSQLVGLALPSNYNVSANRASAIPSTSTKEPSGAQTPRKTDSVYKDFRSVGSYANLKEAEDQEKRLIQKRLEEFQNARREFLKDASTITTPATEWALQGKVTGKTVSTSGLNRPYSAPAYGTSTTITPKKESFNRKPSFGTSSTNTCEIKSKNYCDIPACIKSNLVKSQTKCDNLVGVGLQRNTEPKILADSASAAVQRIQNLLQTLKDTSDCSSCSNEIMDTTFLE